MANSYFQFKEFNIHQDRCAMKVCTDSCLFGAWVASHFQSAGRVLDIGAGTGLLMLMLAQQSTAEFDGIEIEPECFEQLTENLRASPWPGRLHAIHGDARLLKSSMKYDLVISNPPFFSNDLKSDNNSEQLAKHSTQLTLVDIFQLTKRLLLPQGQFALLMPAHRTEETHCIASEFQLFIHQKAMVHQTENHEAFRAMYILGNTALDPIEPVRIDIRHGGQYSNDFAELCKEYYLAL